MKFSRPRSLNGLILVGFGLVALPLLVAVIWALLNLDRVAEQSETLVDTGAQTAESNRRLNEQVVTLERVARQYLVLDNPEVLQIMRQDLRTFQSLISQMAPLIEESNATMLAASINEEAMEIVRRLSDAEVSTAEKAEAIGQFAALRARVGRLTVALTATVDSKLMALQETARDAQRVSAWQVALLVPGTIVLVLFFIFLVARPIRQIDEAIGQLGESGFFETDQHQGPDRP